MANQIPEGFEPFPSDGSFGDVLQPFYMKYSVDKPSVFGLQVQKSHLNPMGICHGGVYMTLMDFSLSANLCFQLGKFVGTPTINFTMDFLSSSTLSDFIWGDIETLKVTNTMGFVQGVIRNAENIPLARANATFKLPNDIDKAPGITLKQLDEMRAKETVPQSSIIK